MAGLFNIFSESENIHGLSSNKGKENSHNLKISKLKSIGTAGSTPAKIFVQPQLHCKPKGLSIRSKSDLNVSTSSYSGSSKQVSKDCLNLEHKLNISKKLSHSPTKLKTPKSKSITNSSQKKISPKTSLIMQNEADKFIFAKPATPKLLKKYPEPETLVDYCDPVNLMNTEMESIFNNDYAFIRSVRNIDNSLSSLDDEGFISDPEQDSFCNALMEPQISLTDIGIDIGLPDISDSED